MGSAVFKRSIVCLLLLICGSCAHALDEKFYAARNRLNDCEMALLSSTEYKALMIKRGLLVNQRIQRERGNADLAHAFQTQPDKMRKLLSDAGRLSGEEKKHLHQFIVAHRACLSEAQALDRTYSDTKNRVALYQPWDERWDSIVAQLTAGKATVGQANAAIIQTSVWYSQAHAQAWNADSAALQQQRNDIAAALIVLGAVAGAGAPARVPHCFFVGTAWVCQ